MRIDELRLLMAIDAALASADGLHVPTLALTHDRSGKTIQRALANLTALGHTHTAERLPDGSYRHRYLRGVKPLFRATPKPDGRGRPKLSADRRAEIIRRLNAGESVTEIVAAKVGTYGTVYRISRERSGAAR